MLLSWFGARHWSCKVSCGGHLPKRRPRRWKALKGFQEVNPVAVKYSRPPWGEGAREQGCPAEADRMFNCFCFQHFPLLKAPATKIDRIKSQFWFSLSGWRFLAVVDWIGRKPSLLRDPDFNWMLNDIECIPLCALLTYHLSTWVQSFHRNLVAKW